MASCLMSQMATQRPPGMFLRCFIKYVPRLPLPMMPYFTGSLAAMAFPLAGDAGAAAGGAAAAADDAVLHRLVGGHGVPDGGERGNRGGCPGGFQYVSARKLVLLRHEGA